MQNRKIAFRAWDRKKKQMWGWHNKFNIFVKNGTSVDFDSASREDLYGFTLMQFTGLVDAKGREIYEGDIVKYRKMPPKVVEWRCTTHGTGFNIVPKKKGFEFTGETTSEIIGNIFENSDLLTTTHTEKEV